VVAEQKKERTYQFSARLIERADKFLGRVAPFKGVARAEVLTASSLLPSVF
jgi:hypothetical protein